MKIKDFAIILIVCIVACLAIFVSIHTKTKEKDPIVVEQSDIEITTVEDAPMSAGVGTVLENALDTESEQETEVELYTGPVIFADEFEDAEVESETPDNPVVETATSTDVVIPDEKYFEITPELMIYYREVGLYDDFDAIEAYAPFVFSGPTQVVENEGNDEYADIAIRAIEKYCYDYALNTYPGYNLNAYIVPSEGLTGDVGLTVTVKFFNSNMVWYVTYITDGQIVVNEADKINE